MRSALLIVLAATCAACGAGYAESAPSAPSTPMTSSTSSVGSGSGSVSGYSGDDVVRVPSAPVSARTTPPAASVTVRPDVLEVDFALRTVVDDPDVGVRTLAETTRTLEARFSEVVPKGALTMRMRAMNVEPVHASGKAKRENPEPAPVSVTADGRLVVALAPAQDYWERSHLAARMKAVADRLAVHSVVSFGHIEPHVRAPEAVRADLAQRWASHRKQSAREVQAGDGVLAREVCAPAARVVERVVSFEEIELTLPIECRRLE